MILSASRRTDLPAFYGEWLESRLREGKVRIPNPYRPHQVREIRFTPETADCIVFWTKNMTPFLAGLERVRKMGYAFYIQHTLTPYGNDLEPGLANKREILRTMKQIGATYGPERLVWRYDPILLDRTWEMERHLEAFHQLCHALKGYAGRCVISFLDLYPGKMNRAFFRELLPEEMERLAAGLGCIAKEYNMPVFTCSEAGDYLQYGIQHSACIDAGLAEKAAGYPLCLKKDPNQRGQCGCAESIDIGMYGSCPHGCRYCYASGGKYLHSQKHHTDSLRLLGKESAEDRITVLECVSSRKDSGQIMFF